MTNSPSEIDMGPLSELPEAQVVARTINGEPALLFREGERVSAIGGECPHAGAPLAEGVTRDGRITCPWHKARFCLRTGALLDPPAVDPLPRYDVRLVEGRVFVAPTHQVASPRPTAGSPCFVILGAGAGGAMAAQTLRAEGFEGRIVLVDQDNRLPYDRTLLSKYVLAGSDGAEKSPLQSQSYYIEQGIERLTGQANDIDIAGRRVLLTDGSSLGYDALLLATGGVAQKPALRGAERRQVFLLRDRADAEALLAQAERSRRAVILGCSFIGMEVAASLRERGLDVTVVGREEIPFAHRFGAPIGQALFNLHLRNGVDFRLGTEAAAIEGDGIDVNAVLLRDGERLRADLVVLGLGVRPATGFAAALKRADDGGIIVDSHLNAAPGIYAAGDIASFPYRGNGHHLRIEHWRLAQQQGIVAARNMMGHKQHFEAVPVFWTIQYLKRLDYIGHATTWDELVLHGDVEKPEFLAYYVKDGLVVAAAGLGRDKDTAALVELLDDHRSWTAAELGVNPSRLLSAIGRESSRLLAQ